MTNPTPDEEFLDELLYAFTDLTEEEIKTDGDIYKLKQAIQAHYADRITVDEAVAALPNKAEFTKEELDPKIDDFYTNDGYYTKSSFNNAIDQATANLRKLRG